MLTLNTLTALITEGPIASVSIAACPIFLCKSLQNLHLPFSCKSTCIILSLRQQKTNSHIQHTVTTAGGGRVGTYFTVKAASQSSGLDMDKRTRQAVQRLIQPQEYRPSCMHYQKKRTYNTHSQNVFQHPPPHYH